MVNTHTLKQKQKPCFELPENSVLKFTQSAIQKLTLWWREVVRHTHTHTPCACATENPELDKQKPVQKYLWSLLLLLLFFFVFLQAENLSVQNMPKSYKHLSLGITTCHLRNAGLAVWLLVDWTACNQCCCPFLHLDLGVKLTFWTACIPFSFQLVCLCPASFCWFFSVQL